MDKNNQEIGNYIYCFDPENDYFNINSKYKLSLNNKSTDVFLIGLYDYKIFISTVDEIKNISSNNYIFYDLSYQKIRFTNKTVCSS